MTREQLKQVVTDFYGRPPPDTYARFPEEADQRLANLYEVVRDQQRYLLPEPIDTPEKAKKLRLLIKKNSPAEIRDSWDDPLTVQILPDGSLEIDNPLPEAQILDLGGTIQRTDSTGKAHTVTVPAQHYIAKAIAEYNATEAPEGLPVDDVNLAPPGSARTAALLRLGLATLTGKRQRRGDRPPENPPQETSESSTAHR
jgi:hypothetical protein